jgi:endonuclease IV
MKEFNDVIGQEYLMAMHLNDSKGELGCKKDRHENIGHGKIGMECFTYLMNNDAFNNIPMILETPLGESQDFSIWEHEIDLLYSLIKD